MTTSSGVRRGENLGFTTTSAVREGTEEVVRGWQQAQDASYTQVPLGGQEVPLGGQEVPLWGTVCEVPNLTKSMRLPCTSPLHTVSG